MFGSHTDGEMHPTPQPIDMSMSIAMSIDGGSHVPPSEPPCRSILRPDTVALMGRNQIGAIEIGTMRTTAPALSNDVDFFPGSSCKWGFGHLINTQPVAGGRSAGSLTWGGLFNTYYWIDPQQRIVAVFMTQVLPFADGPALRAYRAFERGLYAAVRAG